MQILELANTERVARATTLNLTGILISQPPQIAIGWITCSCDAKSDLPPQAPQDLVHHRLYLLVAKQNRSTQVDNRRHTDSSK